MAYLVYLRIKLNGIANGKCDNGPFVMSEARNYTCIHDQDKVCEKIGIGDDHLRLSGII